MPRLPDPRFAPDCTIEVDGQPVAARAGESIAAALIAAGRFLVGRSPKYHRPRGPFCLAGSCHACLARVDGIPNRRVCRVPAAGGLVVTTQNSVPSARHDLLAAIDRVFPSHLDHHHLATWNAFANRTAVTLSRALAGTGVLADRVPPPSPAPSEERFDVAVVGAGPAGLAAAEAAVAAGSRVLLVEGERRAGGRLRCDLQAPGTPSPGWIERVASAVRRAGGEVRTGSSAAGIWPGAKEILLACHDDASPPTLRLAHATVAVLATGTHAVPPSCPRNDLPGIFGGRGIARLLAEDGIVPGRRCVVAGSGAEHSLTADALARAGVGFVTTRALHGVEGGTHVRHALLEDGQRIPCDAVVWCGPRAPAWDLARSAGVGIEPSPGGGWSLRADERGVTAVARLLVAGEVVRPMTVPEAIEAGHRAGEAAQRHVH